MSGINLQSFSYKKYDFSISYSVQGISYFPLNDYEFFVSNLYDAVDEAIHLFDLEGNLGRNNFKVHSKSMQGNDCIVLIAGNVKETPRHEDSGVLVVPTIVEIRATKKGEYNE